MNKKGFTLIEIIGVVTVLSLILIVAVPALTKTLKRNEQNRYDEFVSTYETAAENYLVDKFLEGEVFDEYMVFSIGELIDAGYINEILVDPKTDEKITRDYNIKVTQKSDETYEYKLLRLPSEYQKVEYIQSTGTQYIDSNYIPNINTTIKIKLTYGEGAAFGAETVLWSLLPPDDRGFIIAGWENHTNTGFKTEYIRFLKSGADMLYESGNSTSPYEIEMTLGSATVTSIDGTRQTISYESTVETAEYSAYVFARNTAGEVQSLSARKIYYLKIYDAGKMVRDFIPCYRKDDNVIGMYDLINDVFYTNQGTDTFLKGADV